MHLKKINRLKKISAISLLIVFVVYCDAETVFNSQEVDTTTKSGTVQNTLANNTIMGTAKDWGLTQDEWARYLQLMQGPDALWYPKLSPAAVLGLNASTPQDQQHFARIVAKEQHDKLAQELQFDQVVHQALLQLYTNEPIIRTFDMTAFNPIPANKKEHNITLEAGDHVLAFIDIKHGLDFLVLPRLISEIKQNPKSVLDIYCVGNPNDVAIRQWAKLNQIPMTLVNQGRITLNQDQGQLQKLAGQVALPYVVLVRNSEAKPIAINSLS